MQRRDFLQSTLALGATGMLSRVGHTSDFLDNLPQNDDADCPLLFRQGAARKNFRFDENVILIWRQEVAIAVKYDKKTMSAPEVQAKGDGWFAEPLLKRAIAKDIPIVLVSKEFAVILKHKEKIVKEIPHDEHEASIVEDLFDNLDVYDVIPKKHCTYIAKIVASAHCLKKQEQEQ